MQGPKKTSRVKNSSNQLKHGAQMSNEWTECTSSEKTLQKIMSMTSKSVAAT